MNVMRTGAAMARQAETSARRRPGGGSWTPPACCSAAWHRRRRRGRDHARGGPDAWRVLCPFCLEGGACGRGLRRSLARWSSDAGRDGARSGRTRPALARSSRPISSPPRVATGEWSCVCRRSAPISPAARPPIRRSPLDPRHGGHSRAQCRPGAGPRAGTRGFVLHGRRGGARALGGRSRVGRGDPALPRKGRCWVTHCAPGS